MVDWQWHLERQELVKICTNGDVVVRVRKVETRTPQVWFHLLSHLSWCVHGERFQFQEFVYLRQIYDKAKLGGHLAWLRWFRSEKHSIEHHLGVTRYLRDRSFFARAVGPASSTLAASLSQVRTSTTNNLGIPAAACSRQLPGPLV